MVDFELGLQAAVVGLCLELRGGAARALARDALGVAALGVLYALATLVVGHVRVVVRTVLGKGSSVGVRLRALELGESIDI